MNTDGPLRLGMKDKFPRGKYRGLTVSHVLLHRPTYVLWTMHNVGWLYHNSVTGYLKKNHADLVVLADVGVFPK